MKKRLLGAILCVSMLAVLFSVRIFAATPVRITQHPQNLVWPEGSVATYSVSAVGKDLTYNWYIVYGGTTYDVKDPTAPWTLHCTNYGSSPAGDIFFFEGIELGLAGAEICCVVNEGMANEATSYTATILVQSGVPLPPSIEIPFELEVNEGDDPPVVYCETHCESNSGVPAYIWYSSDSPANYTFMAIGGGTEVSPSLKIPTNTVGEKYYCCMVEYPNGAWGYSGIMKVTVHPKGYLYDVWVGSVRVNKDNKNDVLGDGTVSFTPGNGSAADKLTLNNANISGVKLSKYANNTETNGIVSGSDLVLEVIGKNTVTPYTDCADPACLDILGNLTITGNGSLNLKGCDGYSFSYGIYANKTVTIDGATVNAYSGKIVEYGSTAIFGFEGVDIHNARVNAIGPSAGDYSGGIVTNTGKISITNSCVLAKGSRYAMSKAPVLKNSTVDTASTAYSGTPSADYKSGSIGSYKYVKVVLSKPAPTPDPTPTPAPAPLPKPGSTTCPRDASCPAAGFTDLNLNMWYHDGIHFCVYNGIMSGTSATTFDPDAPMNRAMIVQMLYAMEGKPSVTESVFDDVKKTDWFGNAVIWASENHIVSGYGGGKFGPNDLVTREQLALILRGYAKFKGFDTGAAADLSGYSDAANISAWATGGMKWAVAVGVISGTSETTLSPKGNATRAQAATMMRGFCAKFAG